VIFGTADTRHLHLKALAAIAQIVRSSSFKERWMQADSPQHLQDLLLLSPRKR
jgi:mannitol/fructose-specific phosphotransferase system IIA component (Ntr-type)